MNDSSLQCKKVEKIHIMQPRGQESTQPELLLSGSGRGRGAPLRTVRVNLIITSLVLLIDWCKITSGRSNKETLWLNYQAALQYFKYHNHNFLKKMSLMRLGMWVRRTANIKGKIRDNTCPIRRQEGKALRKTVRNILIHFNLHLHSLIGQINHQVNFLQFPYTPAILPHSSFALVGLWQKLTQV